MALLGLGTGGLCPLEIERTKSLKSLGIQFSTNELGAIVRLGTMRLDISLTFEGCWD